MSLELLLLSGGDPARLGRVAGVARQVGLDSDPLERHLRGSRKRARGDVVHVVGASGLRDASDACRSALARIEAPVLVVAPRTALGELVASEVPFDDVVEDDACPEGLGARMRTLQRLAAARTSTFETQKLAELGAILAGVAHELKNPLAYVRANLQTLTGMVGDLRRELQVGEPPLVGAVRGEVVQEVQEILHESATGVERLIAIVRDLRACSSRGAPRLAPTDLNDCAGSALNLVRGELARVRIERRLGTVPQIRTDGGRIVQVLVNLLVNARDATGAGGRIVVGSGTDERGCWLAVEDDGIGMDAATLARAFEPFFTTKPPDRGTGLGLAISRQLVEELGGELRAESEPRCGSRFAIHLPLQPATSDPGRGEEAA